MGVYDRDRTFNFITRNGNKDKIIDKKWLTLSGLLEETNNTNRYSSVKGILLLNMPKQTGPEKG